MKATLKWIARLLFGRYTIFKIFMSQGPLRLPSSNVEFASLNNADELERSNCPELRELAGFFGEDAYAFGAWVDGRLAAACWFWVGERNKRRNFWPLAEREAKLVQITTNPELRKRGIATGLIGFGAARMQELGYRRFYARIWHSNNASLAAFSKAGWIHVATVVHLYPFGKRIRWCIRHSANSSANKVCMRSRFGLKQTLFNRK